MFKNLLNLESAVEKNISIKQFIYLIITIVLSTATIFLPSIVAAKAAQDSWISVLIATAFSIPVFFLYYKLAYMFKDRIIFSYIEDILGGFLGKIVSFLYQLFFLHIATIMLRELIDIMRAAFMPKTPPIVFSIVTMIVVAYAVTKGFIAIVRMNEIIFPFGMALLGFVIFFSLPYVKMGNFLPILEYGIVPPIKGSIPLISWMLESVVLLAIFPHISDSKKAFKGGIIALLLICFALLLGVFAIGIFGAKTTADFKFAALEMTRIIRLSNYFSRLDSIIMAIWIEGIYLKITIFTYIISKGFAETLKYSDYRYAVLPIVTIMVPLSILISLNIDELYNFMDRIFPYEMFVFEIFLPLFIYFIAKIKKLDKNNNVQRKT